MSRVPEDVLTGLVTVRVSSARLPGKCLLPFGDGTVLHHIVRRARFFGIEVIICTSVNPSDDPIRDIANELGVECFRGSMINKLKRWSDCAEHFGLTAFHTVDADDPFFDGADIHRSMSLLFAGGLDMVSPTKASSAGGASVGYSLTADIVRRATISLDDDADTEMMWSYIDKVPGVRSVVLPSHGSPRVPLRLTLDYPEDYWLLETIRRILGNLVSRGEIDDLFVRNPDLHKINWFRNAEWKSAQNARQAK